MRSRWALVIAAAAIVTASADARADVAPPDTCSSVGQPCNNAGPSYNAPGVCVQSSCSHPVPDGGSSSYPCSLCQAGDGGGGSSSGTSSGGSSGGSSSGASDAGSSSGGSSSKSGCATSPLTRDGVTGFAMLAVGVGALAWARRRRP